MHIIKSITQLQRIIKSFKSSHKCIGFVPTMGYLHAGHLSLVRRAKRDCDVVVVSIFVNPTQFGPREDFKKYPRNLRADKKMLKALGVDLLFIPAAKAIYPKGFKTHAYVNKLFRRLCGKSRPTHFQGVTTVVEKFFKLVCPDSAYFGRKDYQQQLIIKQMVRDLAMPVKIISLPIVREPDGLAMSSRNKYLTAAQRKSAAVLCQSLQLAKRLIVRGEKDPRKIISQMCRLITSKPYTQIDYIVICDPETLDEVKRVKQRVVVLVAVWVGRTRLIDNCLIAKTFR
jgi:pantoate--beta-alanine ligase